jgi:hypothetical protein
MGIHCGIYNSSYNVSNISYNREKTVSSTDVAGKVVIHLQETEIRSMSITLYSINSKFIMVLNIGPESLKLVQEGAGNTLELICIGKDFLKRILAAQELREKMDKWDFIKLKCFCTTKEMISKLKRIPAQWEKTFASYTSKD